MSEQTRPPNWLDRLGVAVICGCAILAAVLEALFAPYYIGTVIAPFAILGALVSNAVLPRMARTLVPSTLAAIAPFAAWLIVVVGFGVLTRPEGDVILPGAPTAVEYVVYGVLLGGAGAGTISIVSSSPPPPTRTRPASQRRPSRPR